MCGRKYEIASTEVVGQFRIHLAMSLCCVPIDGYSKIKIEQNMEIVERTRSTDGGCKYLLSTGDLIKTVESTLFYLDEQQLPYLCVSCQIGCAIGCVFCETGRQKHLENLDSDQIIRQVEVCLDDLKEETKGEIQKINTVLFAGMGEPMLNWPELKKRSLLLRRGE